MDEDSKNTKIIKITGELWGEFYASKCFSAFFFWKGKKKASMSVAPESSIDPAYYIEITTWMRVAIPAQTPTGREFLSHDNFTDQVLLKTDRIR
jgi:hypothetical protein